MVSHLGTLIVARFHDNPKPGTRNQCEDQNPMRGHPHVLDIWAFGICICFGLRVSSLGPGGRYLAAVNGAAAKLTLKRLHQMETTRYLPRSTFSGSS